MAAALPGPAGPEITEMLLHTLQDPDARASDHEEIFEGDKVWRRGEVVKIGTVKVKRKCLQVFMKAQQSTNESAHVKEGGRTALHVACQRASDHQVSTGFQLILTLKSRS